MELAFALWITCVIASAVIAQSKGNNGCAAAMLGFVLGPIGLLIVAVWPKAPVAVAREAFVEPGKMQTCPSCRSIIPAAASVCRFCQRDVVARQGEPIQLDS